MADILDFEEFSRSKDDDVPLEEQVFQCECGNVNWLVCKDDTIECSECGSFMGIYDFLEHTRGTKH